MINQEKIMFQKSRDFGQKLNATFEFIRQNFKKLLGAVFRIVGIPLLIFALIWGALYFSGFAFLAAGNFDPKLIGLMILGALVAVIVMLIYQALFYGTIYEFILLYIQSEQNDFTITDVSREVRGNLISHIVTIAAAIAIILAVALAPVGLMILVAQESPFLLILLGLILMVLVLYVAISLALFVVIRMHEKISVTQALSRSFDLIRGKWWSTFGLIFVCSLIQGAVGYLALIPYYIIIFVFGFSGGFETLGQGGLEGSVGFIIISVIFYTLYMVLSLILSLLSYVAIAFQYYNLVEIKEAKGLMERMETFGQAKQEDEGHY